jgi:hypothetical protein
MQENHLSYEERIKLKKEKWSRLIILLIRESKKNTVRTPVFKVGKPILNNKQNENEQK